MFCFAYSAASTIPFKASHQIRSLWICNSSFLSTKPLLAQRESVRPYQVAPAFPENAAKSLQVTMADKSSSLPLRIAAGILIGGLVLGSFLPVLDAFQNVNANNAGGLLDSQLSRVPVFTVTDDTGRPYLSETDDHKLRRGYFFIQPADADKFLQQIKSDYPDSKVLAVGLNKAVKFLDSKPLLAKSIPEKFELFPDDKQSSIAGDLTNGAFQKSFGQYGVPIFYVEGLAVKDDKAGTAIYPLFFEKAKLDETLENLKKNDPKSSLSEADLQVIDLSQTIKEIRAGVNPRLNQVVFVPLTESLQRLKILNAESSP